MTTNRSLTLADGPILAWPEHLGIALVHQRPTVGAVRFDDTERFHPALLDAVLARESDPAFAEPKAGGHRRVADLCDWDLPETELICLRASKFCKAMMNTDRIALQQAEAITVRQGQMVPPTPVEDAVAVLTYRLAGEFGMAFQHLTIDDTRMTVDATTPSGTLFATPADMALTVPALVAPGPLVLLSFGFRRLP